MEKGGLLITEEGWMIMDKCAENTGVTKSLSCNHHSKDQFMKDHQWMLNQARSLLWRAEYMYGLKVSLYQLLVNCKRKILTI